MIYSHEQLEAMILPLLRKYRAEKAMLFGSYATGKATPESDIDLVIFGGSGFRPVDIFAIAEELHLCSKKRVDAYEISEIEKDSPFYHQIFHEGIFLQ
ncbi:MAG: nucleotidyltransferase domain-containing protein [Firmicutes bacterium]|nr:nucleotidyltransferase domain-containing protein [Bacillota bacterium]MBQ4092597.1 nucleotidyltransferase domain-containing protein [Bacillota bacterium]